MEVIADALNQLPPDCWFNASFNMVLEDDTVNHPKPQPETLVPALRHLLPGASLINVRRYSKYFILSEFIE